MTREKSLRPPRHHPTPGIPLSPVFYAATLPLAGDPAGMAKSSSLKRSVSHGSSSSSSSLLSSLSSTAPSTLDLSHQSTTATSTSAAPIGKRRHARGVATGEAAASMSAALSTVQQQQQQQQRPPSNAAAPDTASSPELTSDRAVRCAVTARLVSTAHPGAVLTALAAASVNRQGDAGRAARLKVLRELVVQQRQLLDVQQQATMQHMAVDLVLGEHKAQRRAEGRAARAARLLSRMTVADAPPAHVHDAERGPVIEPASPVLPAPVPLSPHRRRRRRRHPPTRLVNREHAGSPAPNATPGAANSSTPTPSSAPLPRPSSSSYATVMASLSVTHQPLDDPPAHGRGASLIPAGASDWQHDSTMAAVRSAAYARARVARAIAATAAEADARAAMPPVIHMGAAGSAGKEDSKASKVQQQQQMLALARVRGTRATATSTTTASVLPIKSAGGSSSKWTGGISAAPSTGAPAVTETTLANVRGNREWARVAAHGAGLVCEPMSLGVHERLGPPRRDPALGGRRSPASGGEDATTPKVRVPPAAAVDPAAMDAWFAAHPHAHTRRSLSLSSSDSFAADDREDHDPEPWNPWTDAKLRARRCGGAGGQQWLGLVPVSPPPTNANTTEAYTGSTGNLWTGDMATSTAADPTSQRHSKPPIPGRTTTTSLQLTGTAQPWETLSMGALANAAAVPPSSFFGSSSSTGRDRPSTSPSPYPSTSSGDSAGSSSATTMGPVVRYANADANGLNAALPQLAVKRGLRNLWTAPAQCGPTGAGARGGGAQQPVAMVAALVVVSPARETWATGILATDSRGLDAIDEEDGVGDGDGEGYRGWANS